MKNEDDISQSWKLVSQSNLRDIRLKEVRVVALFMCVCVCVCVFFFWWFLFALQVIDNDVFI